MSDAPIEIEKPQSHPIAAMLRVVLGVGVLFTIGLGLFLTLLLLIGIFAQLAGGELTLPFGRAYNEAVPLQRLIVSLVFVLTMVPAVVYIGIQLRRILSTQIAGDPFVPENAARLRRIAIAVAVLELVRYVIYGLTLVFPAGGTSLNVWRLTPNLAAWMAVGVLIVLSAVFREGARLREEEKMTV